MSIRNILKSAASRLPVRWQNELKRMQFGWEIRRGRFFTDEKEYSMLADWVSPGDWVLDVGANIGHYTFKLSEKVGETGRVLAFEPVPRTFELLTANVSRLPIQNVTLLNLAASSNTKLVGMSVPKFASGLDNYYMAHVSDDESSLQIMTAAIDSLGLEHRVSFVKVDAEGHELEVLQGMVGLLERDRPTLVVEDNSPELALFLEKYGYSSRSLPGSSNAIFESQDANKS